MRDRRQGLMTDTGHARRWNDKLFGFILGILLVFLLNWILGCQAAPASDQRRTSADCKTYPEDFRCQVYLPEEDPELDTFDEIVDEDF